MPKGRKKLVWINPLSHYVYQGWLYLFDKYFDLEMYDNHYMDVNFGKHGSFVAQKSFKVMNSFFNIYRSPVPLKKVLMAGGTIILGDIFTNSLCWTHMDRRIVYYSEYFHLRRSLWRKLFFYIFSSFFRRKKFLVPTKQSYQTFTAISKKVLYFPQLYDSPLFANKTLNMEKLKILYVGSIGDWKKNVTFLLETLSRDSNLNFQIGLCGRLLGFDLEKWQNLLGDRLVYYGAVAHDKLDGIYLSHNVFVLPSKIDPIGAVVLEAMAHSLPIITTRNVGASSYIKEGENGFIIDSGDADALLDRLKRLSNRDLRTRMGEKSRKIVRSTHWCRNKRLMKGKAEEFLRFSSSR